MLATLRAVQRGAITQLADLPLLFLYHMHFCNVLGCAWPDMKVEDMKVALRLGC